MNEHEALILLLVTTAIWHHVRARRRRRIALLTYAIGIFTLPYDRAGRRIGESMNRTCTWWEDDALTMREYQFRKHFRLKRSVFDRLVQDLNLPPRINGLPCNKVVAICMYRLATGCTIRELTNLFAVSESTAHKYTKQIVNRIIQQLANRIRWPQNDQDRRAAAGTFLQYGPIYGCVGALDGSLVKLKRNPGDLSWLDYDGNYSMQLQGVVDGNMRFIHVFAGCQGSFNDKRVFRLSSLPNDVNQLPSGYFIIADNGYAMTPKVMIPYRQTQAVTRDRMRYNYWLSRSRIKIEHAFGSTKSRFRILQDMDMEPPLAARTITACCILHNYCLDENDEWPHDFPDPQVPPAPDMLPRSFLPPPRQRSQRLNDAHAVRRSLVVQLRNSELNSM